VGALPSTRPGRASSLSRTARGYTTPCRWPCSTSAGWRPCSRPGTRLRGRPPTCWPGWCGPSPRPSARAWPAATTRTVTPAPAAVERAEAAEQRRRWPGWEAAAADLATAEDVEQQTWAAADRLTCASDYVRDGLVAQGVEAAKVHVIPYPVAAPNIRPA